MRECSHGKWQLMTPKIEAYGVRTVIGRRLLGNSIYLGMDMQDKFFFDLTREHVAKCRNVLFHTHKDISETDLLNLHSEIMENWDAYWRTSILLKKDTRPFAILDYDRIAMVQRFSGSKRDSLNGKVE